MGTSRLKIRFSDLESLSIQIQGSGPVPAQTIHVVNFFSCRPPRKFFSLALTMFLNTLFNSIWVYFLIISGWLLPAVGKVPHRITAWGGEWLFIQNNLFPFWSLGRGLKKLAFLSVTWNRGFSFTWKRNIYLFFFLPWKISRIKKI